MGMSKQRTDEDGNKINKDGSKRKRPVAKPGQSLGRPRLHYHDQLKRSELVAIEFFMQGHTKTECMIKAGYSEKYAIKEQYKFFSRKRITREIEQRRWALTSRSRKMTDRIQDELAKIAFFNIGEVIEVTDDGDLIFDFSEATMDNLAAVGTVTVETYVEGRGKGAVTVKRIKVTPLDKKAALDSLCRIHGMFNDRLAVEEGGSLEERLQAGRNRVNQAKLSAPEVIEGEFEEV